MYFIHVHKHARIVFHLIQILLMEDNVSYKQHKKHHENNAKSQLTEAKKTNKTKQNKLKE